MEQIKYPIGIQTFEDIIEGKYLYVDKTDMVHAIADKYDYVFLSRPRRFGKSLLSSTFEAYFKGERELFKGLKMENLVYLIGANFSTETRTLEGWIIRKLH